MKTHSVRTVYKFQPLQNCLWHLKILCSLLCMPIFWMLLEEVKRYKFPTLIVLTHRWKWTLRLLPHTIFLIVPAMSKIICPFILTTLTQSPQPNKLTICKFNVILIQQTNEVILHLLCFYFLPSIFSCSMSSEKSDASAANLLKPSSVFFFAKYRVSIFAKVCNVLWAWN